MWLLIKKQNMKIKNLLTTIIVLFAFSITTIAQKSSHDIEVFIEANSPLKVVEKGGNTKIHPVRWVQKNQDNFICAYTTGDENKWKKINFTFQAEQDDRIRINLRSFFFRNKEGRIIENISMFKDLEINGKPFASNLFKNKSGEFATYSKRISDYLNVKKGEKIELSVMVKGAIRSFKVDISQVANKDASKYLKKPISFNKGTQNSNDILFKLLDSNKIVSAKEQSVQIPINNNNVFPYIYVLANISDDINYADKACGRIDVFYKNGEKANVWVRKDRDFLRSFDNEKASAKGLRVKLNGASDNAGSVYMTQFQLKENSPIEKIELHDSLNVFAITLSQVDVSTIKPKEFNLSEWKPVDMSNLAIKDGSALDVSQGIGEKNAGKYGFARIGESGHFEFEKMPNKPVKFKGTNWRPGDSFGRSIKTHEQIDQLAKMARKQGYNLIRWRLSMRKDEFESPYQLKEFNKDLYDYFFYAFAREGVYHHFNLASHDLGDPSFTWEDRFNVKILMFFGEPKTRESWRKLMHYQLNLVNKYTGKKWKDDPSIVSTEYFNEIEPGPMRLRKASNYVKNYVDAKFVEYLKQRYKSLDDLKKANPDGAFNNLKKIEDAKASTLVNVQSEYARFIVYAGRQMQEYCEKVIREEIGFKAPLHLHNCDRSIAWTLLSAEAGDYNSLNVYHNHPSRFMDKGSHVYQTSSISDFGSYFLAAVSKRIANRPMMLSEWQHCYWNPFTHEGGVLFPAYASFQGFDNLTVHDQAICLKASRMGCFEVGSSPVFRANEFLSYSMFYRGDVATTKNRVDMVYDQNYIDTNENIGKAMNREQSKVALMTGFAVEFPTARKTKMVKNIKANTSPVLKMKPNGFSGLWANANFTSTGEGVGEYRICETEKLLREKGILGKDNITNSANGVFQSDTGEIIMRAKEKVLKVITAKTEAITLFPETKNEKLGRATLVSTSIPSAFAVISVDEKPISESKRMVVIFNTDNIMTDLKVTSDREVLLDGGRTPVLMQTGKLVAKLKVPNVKLPFVKRILNIFKKQETPKYALYALKINGERMQKLPLEIENGEFVLNIDTTGMKETTPFFELIAE